MVESKNRTDKKVVGNYKAKFKTTFNKDENDFIFLNISFSDDLIKLIKSVCVLDETKIFEFDCGEEYDKYERYLVKGWVYGAIYSHNKDFLFTKKLIEENNLSIKISNVSTIDSLIDNFKESLRRLIEVVLKYQKIDISVNFNPSQK